MGPRRADGYHSVVTVIQSLELHDRVRIRLRDNNTHPSHPADPYVEKGSIGISVRSRHPGVPDGEKNLAWLAVEKLIPHLVAKGYGGHTVEIEIVKDIPVAAGLGGGSSNAAAVLRTLNQRLALGLSMDRLLEIGAQLGSDVPACIIGGTTVCWGRGEKCMPLPAKPGWWVLANPGGTLGAGQVYTAYSAGNKAPENKIAFEESMEGESDRSPLELVPEQMRAALASGDVASWTPFIHNDLQEAACSLHSGISPLLKVMHKAGALTCLVSGSGPTVAGTARDEAHAQAIAEKMRGHAPWVWWGPTRGAPA